MGLQALPSRASSAAGASAGSTGLSAVASAAGASLGGGAPPTPTWLPPELQDDTFKQMREETQAADVSILAEKGKTKKLV